jgi:hypothetical protein
MHAPPRGVANEITIDCLHEKDPVFDNRFVQDLLAS